MKNEVERLLNGRGLEVKSDKNLTENLREWRENRNIINPNTSVLVDSVIEELLEIFYDDKQEIKFLQNEIMDLYFDKKPISELNTIDSIKDIKVFSINETEQMGYDDIKTDDEVFKHINCRRQDPMQYMDWDEFGANGKWKKDANQPKDEIYEPNYESCKL